MPRFIPGLAEDQNLTPGNSLEDLVNRSSLMDVLFRGMQRQNTLMYLAALDNPSAPEGNVSDINMQSYEGKNKDSYLGFTDENVSRWYLRTQYSGQACDCICMMCTELMNQGTGRENAF